MLITDLNLTRDDRRIRASAQLAWEDCAEPAREVFFETEEPYGDALAADPGAFLTGCLVPAMRFGERRIRIDGAVDPSLLEGLTTVMGIMRHWSVTGFLPLALEAPVRSRPEPRSPSRRAGTFLSGGIDSLALLRGNRLRYPREHPGSIRDCVMLHGFEIGGVQARGPKYHVFERARRHMEPVAQDAGVELIPLYTNVRHLCDERELWLDKFCGAVLAAAAHALGPRLHLVYIASSYDLPNLVPCAIHPFLDPEFSSFDLRLKHRDLTLSRLDKLRLVADWPAAFQNFRVCLANVPDQLNCGRCEKCVRTMTELVALGRLQETRAFAADDVTPELFEPFRITIRHRDPYYREVLPLLRERGRRDLVEVIESKLRDL